MKFQIYEDNRGEWRWRLRGINDLIIAVSSEGYIERAGALAGILLVKASSDAPIEGIGIDE